MAERTTTYEMVEYIHDMVNDDRYDDLIPMYLEIAQQKVVERLWPFAPEATWDDVPDRYWGVACNIAVYLINKRGAEGETTHRESGTSRTWASADVPNVMFAGITPHVGVPR